MTRIKLNNEQFRNKILFGGRTSQYFNDSYNSR